MKKVILSIAIIAGVIATTNIQTIQAGERPSVNTVYEDDGFVDVKLEDLNEQVQQAINALTGEYDVKALKYSAEKQLTKVKLTKKDDQSARTIFFNDQGEEVEKDRDDKAMESRELEQGQQELERQGQELQEQQNLQQPPSVEQAGVTQDKGFQDTKFEDLNERVQESVRQFANEYDITGLQYDSDKKIAKITGKSKEDQSEKTIHLNDEGQEVNLEAESNETERMENEEAQTPKG